MLISTWRRDFGITAFLGKRISLLYRGSIRVCWFHTSNISFQCLIDTGLRVTVVVDWYKSVFDVRLIQSWFACTPWSHTTTDFCPVGQCLRFLCLGGLLLAQWEQKNFGCVVLERHAQILETSSTSPESLSTRPWLVPTVPTNIGSSQIDEKIHSVPFQLTAIDFLFFVLGFSSLCECTVFPLETCFLLTFLQFCASLWYFYLSGCATYLVSLRVLWKLLESSVQLRSYWVLVSSVSVSSQSVLRLIDCCISSVPWFLSSDRDISATWIVLRDSVRLLLLC